MRVQLRGFGFDDGNGLVVVAWANMLRNYAKIMKKPILQPSKTSSLCHERSVLHGGVATCALVLACLSAFASAERFMIFDNVTYAPHQLPWASQNPVQMPNPKSEGERDYLITRSPDGHYYLPGRINGFPVVFMIDTGATNSVIPQRFARNAGIRAGSEGVASTANGKTVMYYSSGNTVGVGRFNVRNVNIVLADSLETPLLGMSVLSRFTITQTKDVMRLSIPR